MLSSPCRSVCLCAAILSPKSCNGWIPLYPSSSLSAKSVCLSFFGSLSCYSLIQPVRSSSLLPVNPTCSPLYCTSHVSFASFFVYLTLSLLKPRGRGGLTLIDALDRGEEEEEERGERDGSGLTRLILFFLAPRHLAAIKLMTRLPREKRHWRKVGEREKVKAGDWSHETCSKAIWDRRMHENEERRLCEAN